MKKALAFFAITFLLFSPSLIAQPPCAFDLRHKKLLETDPVYARTIAENSIAIRKFVQAHPINPNDQHRLTAVYTIPVVVHVMHTGGAVGTIYNPSDAQIQGAINYLNSVYAGTFSGMTAPIEGGGVVDMEIQFGLAQRTPSCGATNGIDRVDASGVTNYSTNGVNVNTSGGASELSIKDLSRWNTANYYNVWVVNKLDGADGTSGQFIAGFAYFPGSPSLLDGTIMLATQMIAGQKTLPHEIGHALNLDHPFSGSDSVTKCGITGVCGTANVDDEVCDTRPTDVFRVAGVYNFSCRTGALNPCDGGNPYTINTENNYMSYTNCYTLFTNGQKSRVQAAMGLASRSSLVAPGNLALVPCGTSINFALASSSRAENITGTLAGCRRYTDYTYQMAIGTGPSAAATATLTYSGTAVRGIDYDVTTNGNFASPSSVLTFPASSTAAQSFTVRVYDDGDVESNETAILDFTVANGGGNAVKGSTTPTFTLTLSDNDVAPVGASSFNVTVGSANTGLTQPFRGQFSDARTQILYTKAQLNAAGLTAATQITSIAFNVTTKTSTGPFNGFTVRMKNTTSVSYTGGAFETGSATVFSGAVTTTSGFNTITLSTPFTWNGNDNLLVDVCFDNSTATGAGVGTDIIAGTAALPQSQFDRLDGASGCALTNGPVQFTGGGARPDIRIIGNAVETAVETVATSTSNMHIDAGSNDFFYSNNNRLLMRLSGISAPLSCVSSTLENAGTTWVSYSGGQRSAKVFAVTPTTNSGSATYTIALYFENAELGGKLASSLRIAKTTAASVAASNPGNTILVTPTVTTLGPNTTVFTASFTGFSRFFLADAGVTLPVELTEFTGVVNEQQNTVLSWITASEFNNRQFDIEISNDGTNFDLLASVLSQGNSGTEQHYEYVHLNPRTGTTWYRLKQTDIDGRFKYSNIIAVTIASDVFKPSIYPVPAREVITVNFNSLVKKAAIEIFTSDMKSVKRETINGPALKKDINVRSLSQGVYFIRITSGNDTKLLRFVKE